jgi:DNA-binding transcriptional LysR family regulator
MDIRAVDLNLLKAFDALMAEGAVTRAARRIGLSQPAMSHALSRLRGLFSDDLFVRTPTRMEPTTRARQIAPLVAAAIAQIEAALNLGVGFDPVRSEGVFTAGIAEYAEVALVGRLVEMFAKTAPNATLRLVPMIGAEAAERLDRGAVDVAVAHLRALPPRFDSTVLLRDPFVLVARCGHPRAAAPLSVEDYAALGHVLVSPRGEASGAIDRALSALGLKRRILLLLASYLALPAALAASDLVAAVPHRTARRIAAAGEIEIFPLPLELSMTVAMAWHRRAANEPAQAWFRALVVEAAAD